MVKILLTYALPYSEKFVSITRDLTSSHNGDFYCLSCFHSYSIKEKFKKHERVCNDHDYCYAEMPSEEKKKLNTTTEKSH